MIYALFVGLLVFILTFDGNLKHAMRVECTSDILTKVTGCPVGYMGNQCKQPCRFPNFGKGCQMECNCTEKHCNHVCGCNRTDHKDNTAASCTQISRSLNDVCPIRCDNNSDNYDHKNDCNIPNTKNNGKCKEKKQHFKLMNTDDLRQCVIIFGCISLFLSVIYAFTFSKRQSEHTGNQQIEIVISREPVYENMAGAAAVEIRTLGDLEMS